MSLEQPIILAVVDTALRAFLSARLGLAGEALIVLVPPLSITDEELAHARLIVFDAEAYEMSGCLDRLVTAPAVLIADPAPLWTTPANLEIVPRETALTAIAGRLLIN